MKSDWTITLPEILRATDTLSILGRDSCLTSGKPPSSVLFDFSKIAAAKPTGIVLMHNITRHLVEGGTRVLYTGMDRHASAAMRFMDSIGFFEDQLGEKIFAWSALRPTSCRLRELRQTDCMSWTTFEFLPWLATRSGYEAGSLAWVETCIKEIFNNIQDHAGLEAGSIFAQWYPRSGVVDIAISDFGRGIPANVGRIFPSLTAGECIIKAFEEGFSTKGRPSNRGAGLDILRRSVVSDLKGTIYVVSGGAVALCDFDSGLRLGKHALGNHGYEGTLINIRIPTAKIERETESDGGDLWT